MTEEIVDGSYDTAADKVEAAHREAVTELKSKLEKAKSNAMKKVSP